MGFYDENMLPAKPCYELRLPVTQYEIDNGVKDDCHNCAVALAVKKYFPNASDVSVSNNKISVYTTDGHGNYWCHWGTIDYIGQAFINRFDNATVDHIPLPVDVSIYLFLSLD